jgi:competence protein ComEC
MLKMNKKWSFYLCIPLFICVIICFAIEINQMYSMLLTITLILIFIFKIKIRIVILYCIIVIAIVLWHLIFKQIILLNLLHLFINKIIGFSLRDKLINFINYSYSKQTSSFITLIVLNDKNSYSYPLYDKMINLSIVYMVVISGFHLTIFRNIINKIIKNKIISNSLSLIFISFYSFLLDFSFSTMRVLLCILIRLIFKNKLNKYEVLGLSGLTLCVLNSSSLINFGFCLSYLCTFIIYFIYDLDIENVFIEKLVISAAATLISLPIILLMNKQISVWSMFFALIFTYLFCYLFIYFLLTFWIIWIAPFHDLLVIVVIHILNAFDVINICIKFNRVFPLFITSYYYVYFLFIIYFHKKSVNRNKLTHDTHILWPRQK